MHQITFSDIHFDRIYLFCTCFGFSFELFLNNNKFMNHPQISAILDDEEEECLHYLTTVRIKVGQECSYVLSESIIHDIINDSEFWRFTLYLL